SGNTYVKPVWAYSGKQFFRGFELRGKDPHLRKRANVGHPTNRRSIPREHRRHAVPQHQADQRDGAGGGRQILARQLARLQREPQPAFYLGDIVVDLLALRSSVGFQHVQRHHVRHTDLASVCSQTWSCLSTSSVRLGATPSLVSSFSPIQAQAPAMMRYATPITSSAQPMPMAWPTTNTSAPVRTKSDSSANTAATANSGSASLI